MCLNISKYPSVKNFDLFVTTSLFIQIRPLCQLSMILIGCHYIAKTIIARTVRIKINKDIYGHIHILMNYPVGYFTHLTTLQ